MKNGTQMTRIKRIETDLLLISENPPNLRHPRSIKMVESAVINVRD